MIRLTFLGEFDIVRTVSTFQAHLIFNNSIGFTYHHDQRFLSCAVFISTWFITIQNGLDLIDGRIIALWKTLLTILALVNMQMKYVS